MEETFVPKKPEHGVHRFSALSTVIIVVVLILLALVAGYAAGWNLRDNIPSTSTTTSSTSLTTTTVPSTTSATASSTYTNTKYGYSFSYPSTEEISAEERVALPDNSVPISPTSEIVNVSPVGEKDLYDNTFSLGVTTTPFTVHGIKSEFGSTSVTPIATTVAGQPAYVAEISNSDTGGAWSNYYVKTPGGQVLEISVPKNNADAPAMFASFAFTK